MSEKNIYFAIQIDCEATQRSINKADLGERASRGIGDILLEGGAIGTYYVIPTDIEAHPVLYRQLEKDGHEIGLHIHPADMGYKEFLGIYGPDEQRKIINQAAGRFAQVMGRKPESICIGYFSANDYTFPTMAEAGFRHGSLSCPTRELVECASVWAGAPLDIHYANAYNRLLPGTLDLVNVPPTVDPDSRMWGGKHPQDLRIELVDAKNHWHTIAKAVDRKIAQELPVKHIGALTHNTYDYSDERDFRRETLIKVIEHAKNIFASKGYNFASATHAQIAELFRQKCPLEKAGEPDLKLDTRGRK
ncbi:MAG: polysaccharide deacetylase family protein [Planctomycetota bacterium]